MDLIENRVQLWIASMPSALPHVQTGKLRALAVTGESTLSGGPRRANDWSNQASQPSRLLAGFVRTRWDIYVGSTKT